MTCEQAAELLSAYVDGELEAAERGALVAHLEACLGCRREWVAVEKGRALSLEAAPSMPLALRASIERAIDASVDAEKASAPSRWASLVRFPSLVPAPAWAAVVAALMAGLAAYSFLPKEEPVPLDRLLAEHVLTDQQTWAAGRGWIAEGFEELKPTDEAGG